MLGLVIAMQRYRDYALFCFFASVVLTGLNGDYRTFPLYLLGAIAGAAGVVLINRFRYD